jgi:DNA-binding beta-propeller fold protein YncE
MYVVGTGSDSVLEYDLSTAWNISTASYVQSFSVSSQDGLPNDIFFRSDGVKMYIIGDVSNSVHEYDLSVAWDISTASYLQQKLVNGNGEVVPTGIFFKPDGTKMYVSGTTNGLIEEYDLG